MKLAFEVTGENLREIQKEAEKTIGKFANAPQYQWNATYDVRPLATDWGKSEPSVWIADVVAEVTTK